MEQRRTSVICSNAKETRVSYDLIYQTTANGLRMRKETVWKAIQGMEKTRLVDNPKVGKCRKLATARETSSLNNWRQFTKLNYAEFAMAKEIGSSEGDIKDCEDKETAQW